MTSTITAQDRIQFLARAYAANITSDEDTISEIVRLSRTAFADPIGSLTSLRDEAARQAQGYQSAVDLTEAAWSAQEAARPVPPTPSQDDPEADWGFEEGVNPYAWTPERYAHVAAVTVRDQMHRQALAYAYALTAFLR